MSALVNKTILPPIKYGYIEIVEERWAGNRMYVVSDEKKRKEESIIVNWKRVIYKSNY